jgi:hypothetical protein
VALTAVYMPQRRLTQRRGVLDGGQCDVFEELEEELLAAVRALGGVSFGRSVVFDKGDRRQGVVVRLVLRWRRWS